ncbi:DUF2271 domain-containing protein [Reinekea sp. G2M2-21]|uniref:DUF2271 domain-containing protein n=1 Tax=Reinekea sp. G2M2-21 TaxID=2788942 RepID=UPI0018AB328A|nr:DUF2271 domain-containing protein [Reinekea sp. G2M2-21]
MTSNRHLLTAALCCCMTTLAAKPLTVQVQIKSYNGEASYSTLYLVNPSGRYEQTLWVSGEEEKYYEEGLSRWWKYLTRKPQALDGITGASTSAGDRYVVRTDIPESFLDAGYALRVETSVEDQASHQIDIEVPLNMELSNSKIPGTGWVSFIRFR